MAFIKVTRTAGTDNPIVIKGVLGSSLRHRERSEGAFLLGHHLWWALNPPAECCAIYCENHPQKGSDYRKTPLTVDTPGVLGNDIDAEGDPLSTVRVSNVSHGTLRSTLTAPFPTHPRLTT
jgi:Bacterial cadherin-like domain